MRSSTSFQKKKTIMQLFRAQSCKGNHKVWDCCPLSLGGKFGKRNRPRSSLTIPLESLPKLFGKDFPGLFCPKSLGNKTEEFGQRFRLLDCTLYYYIVTTFQKKIVLQ